MATPIRVLVADDSAFARKVIRHALESCPVIEVVGVARDGLDALEQIERLQPDVLTLDLLMPGLDGVGVVRALHRAKSPRVVVVSTLGDDHHLAIEALREGAVAMITKPTALATQRLYDIAPELVQRVLEAGGATPRRHPFPIPVSDPSTQLSRFDLIVIGTSTGGPQALHHLISSLPDTLPPIVMALHIPEGYTAALAHRLDEGSRVKVLEASDGTVLAPGRAVLARGGMHLRVAGATEGAAVVRLDVQPLGAPYVPSVDVLFTSAAAVFGSRVLAVVLTGMGNDGLVGARHVREAQGMVLTEASSSCVVFGMPRAIAEAGLASGTYPLHHMAEAIVDHVRYQR